MEADKIKAIREKLNLSQKEFGELLGVHFTTVNRWERGKFDAEEKILKVLQFLEVIIKEAEKKNSKIKLEDIKKLVEEIREKKIESRFHLFYPNSIVSAITISPLISLLSAINILFLSKKDDKKP
ncbi:MAG: helix-turn-helix domain-containing protein [Deltaproteobacteria bacterium]|nr:helix-turn-helix domain-containing protein [Deltaproteobacteria bacterium]